MKRGVALALAAAVFAAPSARSDCSLTSIGMTPLPDAGPRFYQGFQGGLYLRGGNSKPPAVEAAALAMANQVQPLDANGMLNPTSGKIVMISIGMSNTTQEFRSGGSGAFKPRADADPSKNPQLTIVDGAQGGQDSGEWLDPNGTPWTTLDTRITNSGVTAAQVQVAWVKHARRQPNNHGAFPLHAQTLASDLATIARTARARFPNLKLMYISSRTRAYTNVATALNPEPFAFEGGFSTKWLIEDQIAGRGNVNWDPARGPVVAPLFLWGPYLWADGTTPRSDGFTWLCTDLNADFTHPSPTGGVPKVATQLLAFFKTDPSAVPWFLKNNGSGASVVNVSANVTTGDAPLTVNFTASASDPGGSIAAYQWTFDDGTFSTEQNPQKIFPAPGRYQARLTVTDDAGNTTRQTIPITVTLTFAGWQAVHFPGEGSAGGMLEDADHDSLTNLAEYALGTDPQTPDAGIVTAAKPGSQLTMTFPRAKFASEATITVEAASDARGPWESGSSVTAENTIADDGIVETVVTSDLVASAERRFLRLRIDFAPKPARAGAR